MKPLELPRSVGKRIRNNTRRAIQTLTLFDNGSSVMTDIVIRRPDELTFATDGLRVTCPNRAGARFAIYELFADDAYQLSWFTRGLRQDSVVLDLGGHIGSFSLAIARVLPAARVDGYEPTPFTAGYFRRNVAQNDLGGRIRLFERAVSSSEGVLIMAICDDGSAHNGVMLVGTPGTTSIEVPTTALAEAFAGAPGPVDLVKFDIEGAEYEAILGSSPDLWHSVSRVVMEYHDMPGHTWSDLERFFAGVGLDVVRRDPVTPRLGMAWLSRSPI